MSDPHPGLREDLVEAVKLALDELWLGDGEGFTEGDPYGANYDENVRTMARCAVSALLPLIRERRLSVGTQLEVAVERAVERSTLMLVHGGMRPEDYGHTVRFAANDWLDVLAALRAPRGSAT